MCWYYSRSPSPHFRKLLELYETEQDCQISSRNGIGRPFILTLPHSSPESSFTQSTGPPNAGSLVDILVGEAPNHPLPWSLVLGPVVTFTFGKQESQLGLGKDYRARGWRC